MPTACPIDQTVPERVSKHHDQVQFDHSSNHLKVGSQLRHSSFFKRRVVAEGTRQSPHWNCSWCFSCMFLKKFSILVQSGAPNSSASSSIRSWVGYGSSS